MLATLAILGTTAPGPFPLPWWQLLVWYFDRFNGLRLQGLSNNPNQIAFLAAVGLCLGLLPHDRLSTWTRRLLVTGAVCVVAGRLSRSTAFSLAAGLVVAWGSAQRIWDGLRPHPKTRTSPRIPLGLIFLMMVGLAIPDSVLRAPPGVHLSPQTWLPNFFAYPEADAPAPFLGFSEASGRFDLWQGAFRSGLRSPLVGLGVGEHAFQDGGLREAHNTFLDLLAASGLMGMVPLLFAIVQIFREARRNGRFTAIALALASLCVFVTFHSTARQPLLWIALFACAEAARSEPDRGPLRDAGPIREQPSPDPSASASATRSMKAAPGASGD